jgi:hypothetical protein
MAVWWLVVPAGTAWGSPDMAAAIKDFGVTELEVRSVQALDHQQFNGQVQAAAARGEAWPQEAILVALQVVGAQIRGHTKIVEVRTPPENQSTAEITITERGYPDDAVAGARWRLWLTREATGIWRLQRVLWANLCSRPGRQFYAATPCP